MPGEDSRWKVCTSRGTILCRHVVNAAGFWGREVDALIRRRKGFEWQLPLVPVHHQYCVTDSVPEVAGLKKEIPVMRDLDGSYYFRMVCLCNSVFLFSEFSYVDSCDQYPRLSLVCK